MCWARDYFFKRYIAKTIKNYRKKKIPYSLSFIFSKIICYIFSIIAKPTKDTIMINHHEEYPMYNFLNNAGYATKDHIEAIKEHGYTPIHRKSYNVKELEAWKNKQSSDLLF